MRRAFFCKWILFAGCYLPAMLGANEKPHLFSIAGGFFDVLRNNYRSFEIDVEYKCKPLNFRSLSFLYIRPLIGFMATEHLSTYLYGGINFDLYLTNHFIMSPGFAPGWYHRGYGKNLYYPIEFRSGVEFSWEFSDCSRLGLHFYHISNAGLGDSNPGSESLVFFFDIPIRKGFPFF